MEARFLKRSVDNRLEVMVAVSLVMYYMFSFQNLSLMCGYFWMVGQIIGFHNGDVVK